MGFFTYFYDDANRLYEGGKAYEMEFVTGEGKTIAVATLPENDIRLMQRSDILHVCLYEHE